MWVGWEKQRRERDRSLFGRNNLPFFHLFSFRNCDSSTWHNYQSCHGHNIKHQHSKSETIHNFSSLHSESSPIFYLLLLRSREHSSRIHFIFTLHRPNHQCSSSRHRLTLAALALARSLLLSAPLHRVAAHPLRFRSRWGQFASDLR